MKATSKENKNKSELAPITLRDPLDHAGGVNEDWSRYREDSTSRCIVAADEARTASSNHEVSDRQWSDVMLLVRRRSHLPVYERAL